MWPQRYWPALYWPTRYWPKVGSSVPPASFVRTIYEGFSATELRGAGLEATSLLDGALEVTKETGEQILKSQ